jgi:hypothetical protein
MYTPNAYQCIGWCAAGLIVYTAIDTNDRLLTPTAMNLFSGLHSSHSIGRHTARIAGVRSDLRHQAATCAQHWRNRAVIHNRTH